MWWAVLIDQKNFSILYIKWNKRCLGGKSPDKNKIKSSVKERKLFNKHFDVH